MKLRIQLYGAVLALPCASWLSVLLLLTSHCFAEALWLRLNEAPSSSSAASKRVGFLASDPWNHSSIVASNPGSRPPVSILMSSSATCSERRSSKAPLPLPVAPFSLDARLRRSTARRFSLYGEEEAFVGEESLDEGRKALSPLSALSLPVALLVGPPCSGKGSLAQRLEATLPLAHVSSGEALRRLLESEDLNANADGGGEAPGASSSELALYVRDRLSRGEIVDSALVARIVGSRLHALATRRPDPPRILLLDGFPRTASQVDLLPQMGVLNAEVVLVLEARDSVLEARAATRLVDPATGLVYGQSCPPPPELQLEANAAARRADDKVEILKGRVRHYREELPKMLSKLRQGGPRDENQKGASWTPRVVSINAERSVEEVVEDAIEALRPLL